ncbi:MAG: HAD hydrolase family protein [Planctomycetota bacterium]
MLTRLRVSVFPSMGVMVFSLALYSRDVYGVRLPDASALAVSLTGLLRYLLLILATPVFLLLGLPILNNALRQMRFGVISTDALAVLGVQTLAELTPLDKVDHLQPTVGDGLNDAPALAAADIGIAMGCGADITREAADVCLLDNDLAGVPIAVQIARRTVRTIKMNLLWAFIYSLVGISLVITGRLNPILAAAAMVLSSLFVVTNSLGLNRAQLAPVNPN